MFIDLAAALGLPCVFALSGSEPARCRRTQGAPHAWVRRVAGPAPSLAARVRYGQLIVKDPAFRRDRRVYATGKDMFNDFATTLGLPCVFVLSDSEPARCRRTQEAPHAWVRRVAGPAPSLAARVRYGHIIEKDPAFRRDRSVYITGKEMFIDFATTLGLPCVFALSGSEPARCRRAQGGHVPGCEASSAIRFIHGPVLFRGAERFMMFDAARPRGLPPYYARERLICLAK